MSEKLIHINREGLTLGRVGKRLLSGIIGVLALASCDVPDIEAAPIDPQYKAQLVTLAQKSHERAESFWADAEYGVGASAPKDSAVKLSDDSVSWRCDGAVADESQEIFYCPEGKEGDVVINPDAFAALMLEVGGASLTVEQQKTLMDTILMHEYGHKLQDNLYPGGIQELIKRFGTLSIERHADCLAGVGLSAYPIDSSELNRSIVFMFNLGTIENIQPGGHRTHGTPEQRANDFMSGFSQGNEAFSTKTAPILTSSNPLRYCEGYLL
jgi:predicted metalloprotease